MRPATTWNRLGIRRGALVLLIALSWPATAQIPAPLDPNSSSMPKRILPATELVGALRKGGLILYFRHTSTDFSRNDTESRSPTDCDNQRPLLDRGREEARAIGQAIRTLRIPIGEVLASPTCRTMETGTLIFGRAQSTDMVRGGPRGGDSRERYAALLQRFATQPPARTNLAIASHGNPFIAVAGPPYLTEGEAAVVRPTGRAFEVIARIRVEDWAVLVAVGR